MSSKTHSTSKHAGEKSVLDEDLKQETVMLTQQDIDNLKKSEENVVMEYVDTKSMLFSATEVATFLKWMHHYVKTHPPVNQLTHIPDSMMNTVPKGCTHTLLEFGNVYTMMYTKFCLPMPVEEYQNYLHIVYTRHRIETKEISQNDADNLLTLQLSNIVPSHVEKVITELGATSKVVTCKTIKNLLQKYEPRDTLDMMKHNFQTVCNRLNLDLTF